MSSFSKNRQKKKDDEGGHGLENLVRNPLR